MKKILIVALIVVAAVLLTAASPNQAVAAGPAYHVVRPGQTLSGIAAMYRVSAWSLATANGIWNWNYIYAGQLLVIPGGYYPVPRPVPNPCPWPGACPRPVPQPYGCSYIVRYGDTMSSIAWRYHVDPWTLARANGIYNLNWIYAGQWLRIPGCYW